MTRGGALRAKAPAPAPLPAPYPEAAQTVTSPASTPLGAPVTGYPQGTVAEGGNTLALLQAESGATTVPGAPEAPVAEAPAESAADGPAGSGRVPATGEDRSPDASDDSAQQEEEAAPDDAGDAALAGDESEENAASDDSTAAEGEEEGAAEGAGPGAGVPVASGGRVPVGLAGELVAVRAEVAGAQNPIPLAADNAATLRDLVGQNAAQTQNGAAVHAQTMLANAVTYSQGPASRIDQSALECTATFRANADTIVAGIEADTESRIGEILALETVTAGEIDTLVDAALLNYADAYETTSEEVAIAIEAKAIAIVGYGSTKAQTVRDAATPRIDRARALRDAAYAPYRNHEDRDDVREAVDAVFEDAEDRFRDGAEKVATEIESFALAAAAIWRSEIPPENAQLNQVHSDAVDALEAERTELKDTLARETNGLIAGLEAARDEAVDAIEEVVLIFNAEVEAARMDAQAAVLDAITVLTDSHTETVAEFAGQVEGLQAAMEAEIAGLDAETCGLFSPENGRAGIEQAFAALAASWASNCDEEERLFLEKCDQAELTFAGQVASAEYNATARLGAEADRYRAAADQVMSDAAAAQTAALEVAQLQLAQTEATVLYDLTASAATITGALDTAYGETVAAIDQTAFDLNADHNGAVYALPSIYADAITEALKAWYEKVLEWIGDMVLTILGGIWDFVVWVGKTLVNIVWGFIWGEAVFPEAWGAGVIVFVADVVAGVLIYGDLRDIFKWGFWRPVVMGEEWTWLNSLMIGLSLVGLFPLYGDFVKVVGKGGVKALIKEVGERVARKLLEEFGEEAGQEIVERLVRDLGGETLRRMTEELGARGVRELVEELGEQGLKGLAEELGEEALIRLARELGADGLKSASEVFGATLLRNLASEFAEGSLKELIDELGERAIRDMAEHVGAPGLRDLAETFTAAGLKELTDEATGIAARAVGELTQDLTAAGLKQLVDDLGVPVVRELVEETTGIGTRALGELAQGLARADLSALVGRVKTAGVRQLVSDMGVGRLLRTIDAGGLDAFRRSFPRLRDPLAISAQAASYSARVLGESLDVVRRFGDNTTTFRIGADGAVDTAEATLREVSSGLQRSGAETSAQRAVVTQAGDEGGHIIGHRFMGDQNRLNMFSQLAHLNDPVFKVLENEVAAWIRHGAEVRMTVQLVDAVGGRPSAMSVVWRIFDDAGNHVLTRTADFLNEAGQSFTRMSNSDIASALAAAG